jgi:arginine deiminase
VPEYLTELLFDDIPYLKVAQEEHDTFANVLRENGAEVLYLEKLLKDVLGDEAVKEKFIYDFLHGSKQGDRRITEALSDYLASKSVRDLVETAMAGVRKDEVSLPNSAKQLHEMLGDPYPFYLDPMPNLYFTRDPAAAIGGGLTINKMHYVARRRESLFMKYIVEHHPNFAGQDIPVWFNRDHRFSMEGGDELVLSDKVVAIGISQRTAPESIETVAANLFAGSSIRKIIAIEIPKSHAFMHLDTVFTMIDYDKFTIHPEILNSVGKMNLFVLTPGAEEGEINVEQKQDLGAALKESLGLSEILLLPCGGGDAITAAREQWNDGSNTLAIAPGVVVTYDRNYVSNRLMREHGVKVIEVPGAELGRGRGGPRCMSMPLVREDI